MRLARSSEAARIGLGVSVDGGKRQLQFFKRCVEVVANLIERPREGGLDAMGHVAIGKLLQALRQSFNGGARLPVAFGGLGGVFCTLLIGQGPVPLGLFLKANLGDCRVAQDGKRAGHFADFIAAAGFGQIHIRPPLCDPAGCGDNLVETLAETGCKQPADGDHGPGGDGDDSNGGDGERGEMGEKR